MTTFFAPERLQTERFTIRTYLTGDGEALADATTSSYDHLRPWMGWATPDQTVEQAETLARGFRGRLLLNTDFTLGIWTPDGTRLMGGTGFHIRGGGVTDATAEIGMWIRAADAGRGLGTAVLTAMLTWGFTDWPWERLTWHCDSGNDASRRTAEKAGMRLEGTLRGDKSEVGDGRRDTLVFGLIRDDVRTTQERDR